MKVYDFNGSNSHITFDDLADYSFTENLSISFLFQLEQWPTSWLNIVQKKKSDYENEFCFRIKNKDVAHWYYGNNNKAIVLAIDIKKYLKLNRWNKISLIRKNNNFLKLYINGELAGERSIKDVGFPRTTEAQLTIMDMSNNNSSVRAKIAELNFSIKSNIYSDKDNEFSLDKHMSFLSSIEAVSIKNDSSVEKRFRIKNAANGDFKDVSQFDLDEAFRNGSVSSIELSRFGRFGNSVRQLLNCMIFAEYYKIKRVYIPRQWYLKKNKSFIINDIEVVFKDESLEIRDEKVFVDKFFNMGSYFNFFKIEGLDYRKAYMKFKDMMVFDEERLNLNVLASDDLVVYFRSGDIFHHPHLGYGQPPLSFYKKIVKLRKWSKIYCVYQDKSNPIIQPFIEYVSNLDIEIREVSGSLEDDIKFLLSSINLVAAPGTFTWAISLISENLRNVFYFNRIDAINFSEIRLNEIKFYDLSGRYVKSIMSNNWENSMAQRELMLNYPEDEILIS